MAPHGTPSRRLAVASFLDGVRRLKQSPPHHLKHVVSPGEASSPASAGARRQRALALGIALPALESPRTPASSSLLFADRLAISGDCDTSPLARYRPLSSRSVEPSPSCAVQHRAWHRCSSGQPSKIHPCRHELWQNVSAPRVESDMVGGELGDVGAYRLAPLASADLNASPFVAVVTASLLHGPRAVEVPLPERPAGSAQTSPSASIRRASRIVKACRSPAATPRLGFGKSREVRTAIAVQDPPSIQATEATQWRGAREERRSCSFGALIIQRWYRCRAERLRVEDLHGAKTIPRRGAAAATDAAHKWPMLQIQKLGHEGEAPSDRVPSPKLSCQALPDAAIGAPPRVLNTFQSAASALAALAVTPTAAFACTGPPAPANNVPLNESALANLPSWELSCVATARSETTSGSKDEASSLCLVEKPGWELRRAPDHDPAPHCPNFFDQAAAALRDMLLNLLCETHGSGRRPRHGIDIPTSVRERYLMSCSFWGVKADTHTFTRLASAEALSLAEAGGSAVDGVPEAVSYDFAGVPVCDGAIICILQALARDPRCARVSLRACQLTSVSAPLLAAFLEMHPGIRHVDLARNDFSPKAVRTILEGLARRSQGLSLTGRLSQGVPETVPKLPGATVDVDGAAGDPKQSGEVSDERPPNC